MQLEEIRRDYHHSGLNEADIHKDPLEQFSMWMKEILESKMQDPTAMSLVSIGTNGFPQSRIVLLKDFGKKGFTFFTNYNSEKAKAIAGNKKVSLHFYWPIHDRQVRISGYAKKTDPKTSEKYFRSRPLNSQLAAIVSNQSSAIPSRKLLEYKFDKIRNNLGEKEPVYPRNWGGYTVEPVHYEFWQGRENRLHDRIVFEKNERRWHITRLAP